MRRLPDWPERLMACVEAARAKPFRWGEHDCCTFAADCVLAMTGVDLAEGFRGTYASAREARALLGRAGLKGLGSRLLGEPIPAVMAGRGDVALVEWARRRWLGVVIDTRVACVGLAGLVFVPVSAIARAWSV